jgi:hypothetical protein
MDNPSGNPIPESPVEQPVEAKIIDYSVLPKPSPPPPGRGDNPFLFDQDFWKAPSPPFRWRESFAVLMMVVFCDAAIFRGQGFAGYAMLFAVAPVLMAFGSPSLRGGGRVWLFGAILGVLAVKMLWCGSWCLVAAGFALVGVFSAVLVGLCPYILETTAFLAQSLLGYEGVAQHFHGLNKLSPSVGRSKWLSVGLPLAAFAMFSVLFIFANPDVLKAFGEYLEEIFLSFREWLLQFSPSVWEVLFWIATIWVSIGLLRPTLNRAIFEESPDEKSMLSNPSEASSPAPIYSAYRNTLATVIVLFAVYLVFEFETLWFHEFPKGFYYSGYAHEGAAWLTGALGLSTLILSLVFRGHVLRDPRLPKLRKLAWVWSFENMLLALAVYHRLSIYIGFNGMTRMRVVGLFGMTAVVVGFVLVIWKILHHHNLVWLMRRHLWTLALAALLYVLIPVDAFVVSYNVRRILEGDPAPSVQISVHPISSEGILLLKPLLDCDDAWIREGVRSMLAQRQSDAERLAVQREALGWTTYQISDRMVLDGLREDSVLWEQYTSDPDKRDEARRRFDDYAYKWY